MPGLIISDTGLSFRPETGLIFQPELGTASLIIGPAGTTQEELFWGEDQMMWGALQLVWGELPEEVSRFGDYRGVWNTGAIVIADNILFGEQDLVFYADSYYFCISGYTTNASSPNPSADTTHWNPIPLFPEENLFAVSFNTDPGPFVSGRPAGPYSWIVTGDGFGDAEIVVDGDDGYATSVANTYFMVVDMAGPVTSFGVHEEILSGSVQFVLAVGGSPTVTIEDQMIHTEIAASSVTPTYWYDGEIGHLFDDPIYTYSSGATRSLGTIYDCEVCIRGQFLYVFIDGTAVYILCHDMVETIGGAANSCYTQVTSAVLGDSRHYTVRALRPL